ncbi:TPA: glycerophosphodiester phosphodiesterase [Enterococcus faecium]|uniref:glycerophosphodiester phosphodiesterase n=1 Tax=Enterococcus faecium TaxID=1352 RepID=UPI0010210341|nr:glycerophosphodiester phosphodiesterase family protein [Enterococcus faecium]RYJ67961.1 glycerophosphodiester phosphodiesterase [Enterococcus faecium]
MLHAGNSQEYPENSLPAFYKAPKNIKAYENDIINTKDNVWVLMHDLTIDRTTNGTGWVQEMTFDELRKYRIDVGPNIDNLTDAEKVIPSLEEYLQACVANEAVPVIELRQRNYPMAAYLTLYATISKYIRLNDCVLMSFGIDVVKALRAHLPTANIWWITYNLNDDVLNTCKQYNFDVDVIQDAEDLTAERVQVFHENGIEVNTWTLYQKEDHQRLLDCNVDHITTTINDINL